MQVLNQIASNLQWVPWQTSLLSHSQRDTRSKGWLPRFHGQIALGLHPTRSLALHGSLGVALKSCPMHLDLSLFIFLGQGRRERTTEADWGCINFRQRESKIGNVSLNQNRKTALCRPATCVAELRLRWVGSFYMENISLNRSGYQKD